MAEWLARGTPEEADRAAASRALSHGVTLAMRTEGRYPEGRPAYTVVVDCTASGGNEHGRQAALSDVTKLLTPAPIRVIEGWLAELSVIVAKRKDEAIDEALRVTAYASRLAAYPADVARTALLGQRWRYWPTWDELAAVCDSLASVRRCMVIALSRAPERPEEREAPDPEARKRMHAMGQAFLDAKAAEDRAKRAEVRVPHWSETAAPDDWRWEALRKAREAAGSIRPATPAEDSAA